MYGQDGDVNKHPFSLPSSADAHVSMLLTNRSGGRPIQRARPHGGGGGVYPKDSGRGSDIGRADDDFDRTRRLGNVRTGVSIVEGLIVRGPQKVWLWDALATTMSGPGCDVDLRTASKLKCTIVEPGTHCGNQCKLCQRAH